MPRISRHRSWTPKRLLTAIVITAAASTVVLTVPSAAAAETRSVSVADNRCTQKDGEGSSTPADPNEMNKQRRPVVYVHGWTGTADQWTSRANLAGGMDDPAAVLEQQTDGRIQSFMFDYARYSTQWANNDKIAACLGEYITEVGKAWQSVGGDGKVIVVAHSMGGLATLYSTSTEFAEQTSTDHLGGVITFDTPYLGAPAGGNLFTPDNLVGGAKEIIHAMEERKLIPATSSDALACLAPHRKGDRIPSPCSQPLPPPLPDGIPLTAIAGNITVKRTTMFGLLQYDLPLSSDGAVPLDSQQGYLSMFGSPLANSGKVDAVSKIDNCSITTGELTQNTGGVLTLPANVAKNAAISVGGLYDVYSDWYSHAVGDDDYQYLNQVVTSLLALTKARCSHINIIHDQPALSMATEALKSYLDTLDGAAGTEGAGTDLPAIPAGARPLFDVWTNSGGAGFSGGAVSTTVNGRKGINSTTQWLSCDGVPAYAEYRMNGKTKLVSWLGFRDFTPPGITATVSVSVDGELVQSIDVDGDGKSVDIDLPAGEILRLEALRTGGTCGTAKDGYMVWGNGYLE